MLTRMMFASHFVTTRAKSAVPPGDAPSSTPSWSDTMAAKKKGGKKKAAKKGARKATKRKATKKKATRKRR